MAAEIIGNTVPVMNVNTSEIIGSTYVEIKLIIFGYNISPF